MSNQTRELLEKTMLSSFKDVIKNRTTDNGKEFLDGLTLHGKEIIKQMLKDKDLAFNINTLKAMDIGVVFAESYKRNAEREGLAAIGDIPKEITDMMPMFIIMLVLEELEKGKDEIINKQVK